jgi:hypothetical protein
VQPKNRQRSPLRARANLVCGCVRPRAQRQIHSFRGPLIRCKQRNPLPAVAELGPRARRCHRRCCWRNTKKQHRENNKRVAAAIVICDGSGERSNRVFSAQRKTPAWFAPEWVCSARSLAHSRSVCTQRWSRIGDWIIAYMCIGFLALHYLHS